MSWTAHYFDPRLNRDAVTRAFGSKDDALRAACDLVARKCTVHSVQGTDNEKLDAVAIMKWCKGHRTALKPPVPKQANVLVWVKEPAAPKRTEFLSPLARERRARA